MRCVASRSNGAFPASDERLHFARSAIAGHGLSRPEFQHNCEKQQRVQSCADIVKHDANSLRQSLQGAQWRRFENVEATKKYKTQQKIFPTQWRDDERKHLTCNFIDHYESRIFDTTLARNSRTRGNPNQSHSNCNDQRNRGDVSCALCDQPPQHHGCSCSPRARARMETASSKKRSESPCPSGASASAR